MSDPYCYLKANRGTYGMAVMTIDEGSKILDINKKNRNKMTMLKGNTKNVEIIVQEGVPTIDKINDSVSEPLIYLVNGSVVGNIFRINNDRDNKINLNTSSMIFKDINNIEINEFNSSFNKLDIIKIYNFITKIAILAASIECGQLVNL